MGQRTRRGLGTVRMSRKGRGAEWGSEERELETRREGNEEQPDVRSLLCHLKPC